MLGWTGHVIESSLYFMIATEKVRLLYDAFAERDPAALLAAMDEDFVGEVSEGMPLGVGGRHEGREAMLRNCWGIVFAAYDMRVEPEEVLPVGDDRVVVLGHYRGVHRESGAEVDAAFAHVLTVKNDVVSHLQQITDTARWVSGPVAAQP